MKWKWLFKILMNKFSHQPLWVLTVCLILLCAHLIRDKTIFNLLQMYNNRQTLEKRISDLKTKNKQVEDQVKKLSHKPFLEREVKDRLNMVGEEDIIFIFSEERPKKKAP